MLAQDEKKLKTSKAQSDKEALDLNRLGLSGFSRQELQMPGMPHSRICLMAAGMMFPGKGAIFLMLVAGALNDSGSTIEQLQAFALFHFKQFIRALPAGKLAVVQPSAFNGLPFSFGLPFSLQLEHSSGCRLASFGLSQLLAWSGNKEFEDIFGAGP